LGLKTEEIEGFDLPLPELVHSKIILVDTPGFSDTNEDRILSQLEAWLYVTILIDCNTSGVLMII